MLCVIMVAPLALDSFKQLPMQDSCICRTVLLVSA